MRYFGVRPIKEEALFDVRGQWGSRKRLADPSQILLRQTLSLLRVTACKSLINAVILHLLALR